MVEAVDFIVEVDLMNDFAVKEEDSRLEEIDFTVDFVDKGLPLNLHSKDSGEQVDEVRCKKWESPDFML